MATLETCPAISLPHTEMMGQRAERGTTDSKSSGTVNAKAIAFKALQSSKAGQQAGQGPGQASQAVNRQAYPPGTFLGDMFILVGAYTDGNKLLFNPPLAGPAIDPERWKMADLLSRAWLAECYAQGEVVIKSQ